MHKNRPIFLKQENKHYCGFGLLKMPTKGRTYGYHRWMVVLRFTSYNYDYTKILRES